MDNCNNVETTTTSRRALCSHRKEIFLAIFLLMGLLPILLSDSFFIALIVWYFGIPLLCLLLRYLWLRLCRDPFLSPSDSFSSIFCETVNTCPPDAKRTLPTIVFILVLLLTFISTGLSRVHIPGTDENEPNLFIVIFYNGFGSLLILICAVWLVDALWLAWLFIVVGWLQGQSGAAQAWWWEDSEDDEDGEKEDQPTDKRTSDVTNFVPDIESTSPTCTDNSSSPGSGANAKSLQLDEERRLAKIRVGLALLFYVWWTAWALAAAYSPHILELSVPIPRLPPQCDGYKFAVAADLHAGAMVGVKDTDWLVNQLNNLNPDSIGLVGDVGDEPVNDGLRAKLAPLAKLVAPAYLSFGNHENIAGIEGYRKLLRTEAPFADHLITLENEHVILNRNTSAGEPSNCSIVLVGMADWSGNAGLLPGQVAPDFPLALVSTPGPNGTTIVQNATPPAGLPMIMMQHQPANMVEAAKDGVGLQVSGHTHGGQLWPQHILLGEFDAISGLHSFDVGSADGPSFLFVSEGVVGWGPRLRFLCKTDIALLTLRTPSIMEAEGQIPDLASTVATNSLYVAFILLPISLLACSVPFFCGAYRWGRKKINRQ